MQRCAVRAEDPLWSARPSSTWGSLHDPHIVCFSLESFHRLAKGLDEAQQHTGQRWLKVNTHNLEQMTNQGQGKALLVIVYN